MVDGKDGCQPVNQITKALGYQVFAVTNRMGRSLLYKAILPTLLFMSLSGCAGDSWFDPSVLGRWEDTPVVSPILDKLDIIETEADDFIETVNPTASDLIPEVQQYLIGASDLLTIDIFELFAPNTPYQVQRLVDQTGTISLPLVGLIQCAGRTEEQIRDSIIQRLDPDILRDPLVSVIAESKRQNTYTILGSGLSNGQLIIPEPRFLLLDALAAAGGIPPTAKQVYVIRQIPLSDDVLEGWNKLAVQYRGQTADENRKSNIPNDSDQPTHSGNMDRNNSNSNISTKDNGEAADDLDKLLDDLLESESETKQQQQQDSVVANETMNVTAVDENNQQTDDKEIDNLLDAALDEDVAINEPAEITQPAAKNDSTTGMTNTGGMNRNDQEPDVEVPTPAYDSNQSDGFKWIYLDGKWIRVTSTSISDGTEGSADSDKSGTLVSESDVDQLVTQRVIEIPTRQLLEGEARYNIVIRPNDIIRVPSPPVNSYIYLEGEVARPGPYQILTDDMTLTRAIAAAGGLGPLGIPEKVDVTRFLPNDRQITVQLNLRAIYEMTEPDIYMKSGDRINVGTTWYAAPLAVIRNGFRMTYGFGFLLDRNFGNDVFGAPPSNVRN